MRCSPKLCIGLVLVGIGSAALLAYSGNPQAAYVLSLLPFLACPLMCVAMMMTGRKCEGNSCEKGQAKRAVPPRIRTPKG